MPKIFALLACLLLWPRLAPVEADAGGSTNRPAITKGSHELRGHIVCLAEEMQQHYQAVIPSSHEHLPGFKTTNGEYYTLLRTKTSQALFMDERLKSKELILFGRVFANSRIFESFNMRSVKNGKIYDLYYFCNICTIYAVTPEECQCCRQPVELMEKEIE